MACSQESQEGLCGAGDWTCTPENIARTCSTFPPRGKCVGLSKFPNATISEYGSVSGADAMAKEIYSRGPIACGIDAAPILSTPWLYELGTTIPIATRPSRLMTIPNANFDARRLPGRYRFDGRQPD